GNLRRSIAAAQARRSNDVGREISIAEPEPGLLAVALEHVRGSERLADDAPAPLAVVDAGQRVHHGVVVRRDEQPMSLDIVGGVHHHDETRAEVLLEAVRQLGPTDTAGEEHDGQGVVHPRTSYNGALTTTNPAAEYPPATARGRRRSRREPASHGPGCHRDQTALGGASRCRPTRIPPPCDQPTHGSGCSRTGGSRRARRAPIGPSRVPAPSVPAPRRRCTTGPVSHGWEGEDG